MLLRPRLSFPQAKLLLLNISVISRNLLEWTNFLRLSLSLTLRQIGQINNKWPHQSHNFKGSNEEYSFPNTFRMHLIQNLRIACNNNNSSSSTSDGWLDRFNSIHNISGISYVRQT